MFGGGDSVLVVLGIVATSLSLCSVENLFDKGDVGIVLLIRRCPVAVDVHGHVDGRGRGLADKVSGGIDTVVALEGDSGGDGDGGQ